MDAMGNSKFQCKWALPSGICFGHQDPSTRPVFVMEVDGYGRFVSRSTSEVSGISIAF